MLKWPFGDFLHFIINQETMLLDDIHLSETIFIRRLINPFVLQFDRGYLNDYLYDKT